MVSTLAAVMSMNRGALLVYGFDVIGYDDDKAVFDRTDTSSVVPEK